MLGDTTRLNKVQDLGDESDEEPFFPLYVFFCYAQTPPPNVKLMYGLSVNIAGNRFLKCPVMTAIPAQMSDLPK
jgi:hypothetical protein